MNKIFTIIITIVKDVVKKWYVAWKFKKFSAIKNTNIENNTLIRININQTINVDDKKDIVLDKRSTTTDWDKGGSLLITERITQPRCVNGNPLLTRGMPMPSTIWAGCTLKDKVCNRMTKRRPSGTGVRPNRGMPMPRPCWA